MYPAAKATGLIQAPTKAVFDVLRREAGSNDPLGCFGQHVYYPRPNHSDKEEQVSQVEYVLKPAKRRVLETYDAHTRIEQVVYKMTNDHHGGDGGDGGDAAQWCSVVPAREFVSINHWRVVSETEHTVVVLNFGTTCMDEVLSNSRDNNNDNNDNNDNDDDGSDSSDGSDDSDSVRGECYGGWMLHPTNNGACTLVTRLVVLDMKMFTPSLERNVVNGVRAP